MQKLQSYGAAAFLLLFSQINCAIPMRQIATSGIGFMGGVAVGIVGETIVVNDQHKKQGSTDKVEFREIIPALSLFSIACTLPALGAYHLLEGNRFGKKLQYGASVLAPVLLGVLANCFYMRKEQQWEDDKKPILALGFVRGLIYGGSALAIRALADFGANKFFPSNT
jgi:hypothetical protein